MKNPNRIVALAALAAALAFTGCPRAKLENGPTLTAAEFAQKAENAQGLVVVDFWATWCPPCRMMKPIFEKAEKDYAGRIAFVSVDADQNPELMQKYKVEALPTFMVFRDGKVQATQVGAMTESDFRAWLDKM